MSLYTNSNCHVYRLSGMNSSWLKVVNKMNEIHAIGMMHLTPGIYCSIIVTLNTFPLVYGE